MFHLLSRRAVLLLAVALLSCCGCDDPKRADSVVSLAGPVAGWPAYGGDPGGSRYSPLTQIGLHNVADLEVAWVFRTGDYPGDRPDVEKTAFQATPILDGDTLYFCTPLSRVYALDAETGDPRWVFDADPELLENWTNTCRGVALWKAASGRETEACDRRIFMGTLDAGLVAIDAETGEACNDFGEAGRVDLLAGLGHVASGETYMTSPPTVIGDIVVTGALVADNRRVDPPGGVIRGFDVRTGKMRWAFDPVPPGTQPLPRAEDGSLQFHRGTPNAWSILSADPERDLVFVPFGNPSPDFFGGHRRDFDYFGSSVVALNGRTGRPIWRYQTVHHDLWDYDVASQPTLIEVTKEGRRVPAVAQATKMGHIFLLHRDTGLPLYRVEERSVPQSDVPGEASSTTQPFPTFPEPVHPHRLAPEDAWGLTPWDRGACRKRIAELRNEGIFTPPSIRGSVLYPGTAGGVNWGSVAFDPERQLLVMAHNRLAMSISLIPKEEIPEAWKANRPRGVMWQEGTPYAANMSVLVSPLNVPCSPPPWGTLLAVDLVTGEKRWEVPLGSVRDMIPVPIPWEIGMPNMGGPIVTASGLAFIGASMDDYIRAYAVETGEEVWRHRLPAGGQATPMTYRVREDGRQFVVIAAGGHATMGTRLGDSLVAFALPERE